MPVQSESSPTSLYKMNDLIDLVEKHPDMISKNQLQDIGIKKQTIVNLLSRNMFIKHSEPGYYTATEKFYKNFRINYPEGELRLDKNLFTPKPKFLQTDWQPKILKHIKAIAFREHLLLKEEVTFHRHPSGSFEYKYDFYPARYSPIKQGHHLLFDFVHTQDPEHFIKIARVHEGTGNWLTSSYYRQLALKPPQESFEKIVKSVVDVVEKKQGASLGRVVAISETHRTIAEPHLHTLATPVEGVEGVYVNPNSKTYVFGHQFYKESKPQQYFEKFVAVLKASGKRFSSITYKTLPTVGVAVSVDTVARSEDKFNAGVKEVTILSGAATGAGLGMSGGLCGSLAGSILGGFFAEEAHQLATRMGNPVQPPDHLEGAPETFNNQNVNYQQINKFIRPYYDFHLFPESGMQGTVGPLTDLTQTLRENRFSSQANPHALQQMYDKLNTISYLTTYHGYWMNHESQQALLDAKEALSAEIQAYRPNAAELGQYRELTDKLFALDLSAHYLQTPDEMITQDLDPFLLQPLDGVDHSNNVHEQLQNIEDTHEQSNAKHDSSERLLVYLKDYNKMTQIVLSQNDLKTLNDIEMAEIFTQGGRAGLELSRLFTKSRPGFAKTLMLTSSFAQVVGSTAAFQMSTGATAIGYAAGGIGAAVTFILALSAKEETDGMKEAFDGLYQWMSILSSQLSSIHQLVLDSESRQSEKMSIYYGALKAQLIHHLEIYRHGQQQVLLQQDRIQQVTEATYTHLKNTAIYQARAYRDGKSDLQDASSEHLKEILTSLWQLLDTANSVYESGFGLCDIATARGMNAAASAIEKILDNSIQRGQLFGYLVCYLHMRNLTHYLNSAQQSEVLINDVEWSAVIDLYLHLRGAPNAHKYDPNLEELAALNDHGEVFLAFGDALVDSADKLLPQFSSEIISGYKAMAALFEYPEQAKTLLGKYDLQEHVHRSLQKFPHKQPITIIDEYRSLVAAGFGHFDARVNNCPTGQIMDIQRNPNKVVNNVADATLSGQQESTSVQYVYPHDYRVVLAWTTVGAYNGVVMSNCHLFPNWPTVIPKKEAEVRAYFLEKRRDFSRERVGVLESNLFRYRDLITDNLLHIKAILIAIGAPGALISALPQIEFPEELSPWIEPYRMDLHHNDNYKAWPYPQQLIENLLLSAQKMEDYINLTLTLLHDDERDLVLYNPALARVKQRLIHINRMQVQLLDQQLQTPPPLQQTSALSKQYNSDVPQCQMRVKEQNIPAAAQQNNGDVMQMLQKIWLELVEQREQNQMLGRKIQHLQAQVDQKNNKIIPYAHAAFTSSTLQPAWPWEPTLLSNERIYFDPTQPAHRFVVRKLSLDSWDQLDFFISEPCLNRQGVNHCIGRDIEYVEYVPQSSVMPKSHAMILNAAFHGALSSALPELLGDIAVMSNINPEMANRIKLAVYAMLILCLADISNLLLIVGVGHTVYRISRFLGLSPSAARFSSSAASFFVSMQGDITTTKLAATTVQHVSGQLALASEKFFVKQFAAYMKQENKKVSATPPIISRSLS